MQTPKGAATDDTEKCGDTGREKHSEQGDTLQFTRRVVIGELDSQVPLRIDPRPSIEEGGMLMGPGHPIFSGTPPIPPPQSTILPR